MKKWKRNSSSWIRAIAVAILSSIVDCGDFMPWYICSLIVLCVCVNCCGRLECRWEKYGFWVNQQRKNEKITYTLYKSMLLYNPKWAAESILMRFLFYRFDAKMLWFYADICDITQWKKRAVFSSHLSSDKCSTRIVLCSISDFISFFVLVVCG